MARLEGKIEAAEEQAEEEAAKIERYNQQVQAAWNQVIFHPKMKKERKHFQYWNFQLQLDNIFFRARMLLVYFQ